MVKNFNKMKKQIVNIIAFLFSLAGLFGQNSTIQGVINSYAHGQQYIDPTHIKLSSTPLAFGIGDTVLVIQMKGGQVNVSNNTDFGTIINFGNAGLFEFSRISGINTSNNIITLSCPLQNTYDNGMFQVVKVRTFLNATVSNTLSCAPWNGQTGGVLVMFVVGTLQLNANIDVTGKGFRGAQNTDINTLNKCSFEISGGLYSYFYTINGKDSSGLKGEGVVPIINAYARGRGKWANGGGGGNGINSAGGGGSNGGMGGTGGRESEMCSSPALIGGIGGEKLYSSTYFSGQRLFLGGGGGSGTYEEFSYDATKGGNGGGIVIIFANSIV